MQYVVRVIYIYVLIYIYTFKKQIHIIYIKSGFPGQSTKEPHFTHDPILALKHTFYQIGAKNDVINTSREPCCSGLPVWAVEKQFWEPHIPHVERF